MAAVAAVRVVRVVEVATRAARAARAAVVVTMVVAAVAAESRVVVAEVAAVKVEEAMVAAVAASVFVGGVWLWVAAAADYCCVAGRPNIACTCNASSWSPDCWDTTVSRPGGSSRACRGRACRRGRRFGGWRSGGRCVAACGGLRGRSRYRAAGPPPSTRVSSASSGPRRTARCESESKVASRASACQLARRATAIPKQHVLRRVAGWGKRFQQNAHLAGHTSCFEKIVDVQASLGPRRPCQLPSVRPHPTYY